jgi:hypothetical protein
MTNHAARCPSCGNLAAGALIGVSMVVAGFALTESTTLAWQAALVVGAPLILVLGIALQVIVAPGLRGRG